MDPAVLAAIVTGGFGIATPLVIWLANALEPRGFLEVMSGSRRRALAGKWLGAFHQTEGPEGEPINVPLVLTLTTSRRLVKGLGTYRLRRDKDDGEEVFALRGGFLHERFLRLTYQNVDGSKVQFGAITLELSADNKTLRGRYVGYGAYSERMVHGFVEVEKVT